MTRTAASAASERFTLVAYRGGAAEGPENTTLAIRRSRERVMPPGVELAIEVDVRMTRDRALVAMHDDTVDRTTDGRGPVEAMTLAEVGRLDAAPRSACRGVRVPTLAEVLEAAGEATVVLDVHGTQDALPAALLAIVRDVRRDLGSVIVASESARAVREVRALAPEVRTCALRREVLAKVALERVRLDVLARSGVVWMVPERHRALRVLTRRFAESAASRGDEVWPWLAEDLDRVSSFRALGATGAFTPAPGAVIAGWRAHDATAEG